MLTYDVIGWVKMWWFWAPQAVCDDECVGIVFYKGIFGTGLKRETSFFGTQPLVVDDCL